MKEFGIVILVIVVLVLLYLGYKFVFKSSEGSACSTKGNGINDGTIVNGVCVGSVSATPPFAPVQSDSIAGLNLKTCPDGTKVPKFATCPINVGDQIYIKPLATPVFDGGIPVYSAPFATGAYLLGVIRPSWYINNPVGKLVNMGPQFSKVSSNGNIKYWQYIDGNPGQYTHNEVLKSGDFFFRTSDIQNVVY